eukprot:CAMPEP_0195087860 /NCGR_PEP_ID=MMETSP0448-20130528/27585_1 /TAXON_ID=66468 /ORGANISM="Heterocapsa triquestra, Strain CCMP 448" /LENGTH=117 /DNA_ID=CAMNT_0040121455 /DNA_START=76 /DNA_END=425 /DNA_ORIENTATION=-
MSRNSSLGMTTPAYRMLALLVAVGMVTLAVAGDVTVTSAEPVEVCTGDVYEDTWATIADTLLLVAVFGVGWALFRPGAVFHFLSAPSGSRRSAKVVEYDTTTDALNDAAEIDALNDA